MVVPVSLWRRYCKTGGLAAGDNAETFKKAFQRVRDKLQSQGIIRIWDDNVWIVEPKRDKGT